MKRIISTIIFVIMICSALSACSDKAEQGQADTTVKEAETTAYAFIGSWSRETEHDTETIRFDEDGVFRYSCACGNPVNDADLCEGYTYNEKTQTITFDYIETTEETITEIKVVKCDGTTLELDFDGDIRVFTKNS